MAPDDFAAWLRLLETPGLGRDGARRLLSAFGTPDAVLRAPPARWRDVLGSAASRALAAEPPQFAARLAAAQGWLAGADNRHVFTLGDAAYPPLLLHSADPPLLLYAQGRLDLLPAASVAIVGSRHPSMQGADNARAFARQLGAAGFVVVSGLALGIDGAAHEGALASPAGTIAVVGTGLDRVYPSRHRALAHRIAEEGVVLSEFAPGTPALPAHFPLRNRIIAGLTRGTLVVEAALRSGSLITARLAAEAGREVFAVPGSIHAPQSRGCHELIRQGAMLVESADEIIETLRGALAAAPGRATMAAAATSATAASAASAAPADPLLDALGQDPMTLDTLQARTGWSAAELSSRLLELELDGLVARLPGGLYQRRHTG